MGLLTFKPAHSTRELEIDIIGSSEIWVSDKQSSVVEFIASQKRAGLKLETGWYVQHRNGTKFDLCLEGDSWVSYGGVLRTRTVECTTGCTILHAITLVIRTMLTRGVAAAVTA